MARNRSGLRSQQNVLARLLAGALVVAGMLAAPPGQAQLRVDITEGSTDPIPVAVTDFYAQDSGAAELGQQIAEVVRADLVSSGLFEMIDQQAFLQSPEALQARPRFSDWRVINAQALVSGSVSFPEDGRLRTTFRLWDVLAETQMRGRAYTTSRDNWRRVAHIIADAIYERITGESGYFDTRIVYVHESGPSVDRTKRLAIMDQDGANHQFLTDGTNLVLSPRFSPDQQEITYLAYRDGEPRVYLFNIDSGQREVVGQFDNMTFAPRFTPSGEGIIFSRSRRGNADLYRMNLETREVTQLTDTAAIDTSPSYDPEGERIVFESDRGGSQQLYIMPAGGGRAERLTFGEGRYATPVWSPRGDLIAFTRIHQGEFYIGVIRPDGTGERMLTQDFHVEGPTWAPNGRVLSYYSEPAPGGERRRPKIYTIDITGQHKRQLPTPAGASDPAWSPPLR